MTPTMLHELRLAAGFYTVPCDGCKLCCQGDAIRILRHEDAAQWHTEPHDRFPGELMLAHKPNGDCYYLGESGCTIQDHKPQMCHEMDCRRLAAGMTERTARSISPGIVRVWRRGWELLRVNPA